LPSFEDIIPACHEIPIEKIEREEIILTKAH